MSIKIRLEEMAGCLEDLAAELKEKAWDEADVEAAYQRSKEDRKKRKEAEFAAARAAGDALNYQELRRWIEAFAKGLGLDPKSPTILKDVWNHVKEMQARLEGLEK